MTYTEIFGTPTGVHTHPLTHPAWMEFADNNCVVCASYPKRVAIADLEGCECSRCDYHRKAS